ncbi:LOW QUALITY PROTEIN: pyruvate kinase [Purpureocillium lavendulum]|uniref:Pyruvate kinase n=1 Tax=Purpureocillium lavendulum TaxID=1247861 RepID=A0AB34FHS2_9HYPO|nr:LOW QUALITY PROTEIN: pyruvate kinase [Purpureocillium lavendulum]
MVPTWSFLLLFATATKGGLRPLPVLGFVLVLVHDRLAAWIRQIPLASIATIVEVVCKSRIALRRVKRLGEKQTPSSADILDSSCQVKWKDHLDVGGRINWLASLNTAYSPEHNYRRSSIICTIGPKTNSVEAINRLRDAGLNVVRMNFSHGSYDYHQSVIDNARKAVDTHPGRPVAIALDTKGPEIRTGNTRNDEDIPIAVGKVLNITTDDKYATACDTDNMYVDYKNITKVIQPGRIIYVDDGVLAFDVLSIKDEKTIEVRARNNGFISSRKGVNLPNTDVDLPALSEKDKADLKFGVKNKVDMVFASFIRRAQDIKDIRAVLGEEGRQIQIIAKIENRQGLNNFKEILGETDGVMVARGDLGIEIPAAEVFAAQKKLIAMCNIAGKPVICATQMLESMIKNPRPTRAEISDVGNAITDGADCVMLSGETAKGNYPVEAVSEMHEACLKAENSIPYVSHFEEMCTLVKRPVSTVESCAMAAVRASLDLGAGGIIVLSTSGESARLLSKYRPVCPIFMVTRNATTSRFSHLYRGVYPFLFPEEKPDFEKVNWQEDVDRRIKWAVDNALKLGTLTIGDTVVVVQGWKGGMGNTNTLRIVLSVANEQPRSREHEHGDETEQGVAPAETKPVVHGDARKGQHGTSYGANDSVSRQGGGGIYGEGVDQVHLKAHEDDEVANANDRSAYDGGDPVNVVLGSPAVDEQAGGKEEGANLERRESIFGLDGAEDDAAAAAGIPRAPASGDEAAAATATSAAAFLRVARDGKITHSEEAANAEPEKDEARVDRVETDSPLEVVGRRETGVELGAQTRVACLLAEEGGSSLEDDGGIRLAAKGEEDEGDDGSDHGDDPEDPAPAEGVGDDAAHDGPDDGAEQRADGETRHGRTALLLNDHVGNGAAAIGEGSRAEDAGQEAEGDEGRQ